VSESESDRLPLSKPNVTEVNVQIDPIYQVDQSGKIKLPNDLDIDATPMPLKELNQLVSSSSQQTWGSYPKVYNLGHRAIKDILEDYVIVQEKVDGSQISFGRYIDENGEPFLRIRSKGAELNLLAPEGMFKRAVETIESLALNLKIGWTYRGEYLNKPKHNALAYDRVPENNIILFDITVGQEEYAVPEILFEEGKRLGLEVVPTVYQGKVTDIELFRSFLDRVSVLGGQKIEGVVVKNYSRFSPDGKAMFGKFVSESFKEVHRAEWKDSNPRQGDILERLIAMYRTPARWQKAVQHLNESGVLENSPKDIGLLLPEISRDLQLEEEVEIMAKLFNWAWPHIRRGVTAGFPEWYKEELLKKQFEGENNG